MWVTTMVMATTATTATVMTTAATAMFPGDDVAIDVPARATARSNVAMKGSYRTPSIPCFSDSTVFFQVCLLHTNMDMEDLVVCFPLLIYSDVLAHVFVQLLRIIREITIVGIG